MAKTASESRRERLATALRANLRRRKAGSRAAGDGQADAPQSDAVADEKTDTDDGALPLLNEPR